MIVLAYIGSQYTKFHTAGWKCWFLTSLYSECCIWPDGILRWILQRNSIKFCLNLGKSVMTLTLIRERLGKKAWAIHGKSKLTGTERGKTGEEQSQEYGHHFLWNQRDCSKKNSPSQAKQSIPQFHILFTVTAWKCVKTSPWTLATKELAVTSRQRTVSHILFFTKTNMTIASPPTLPSLLC
jgi:hypothetical protein